MIKPMTTLLFAAALSLTGGTCLAIDSTYDYTETFVNSIAPNVISITDTENKETSDVFENRSSLIDNRTGIGETPINGLSTPVDVDDGIETMEVICDELIPGIYTSELCAEELLNLEVTSLNGGNVTWNEGVENGVAFYPSVGVTTFTATSDHINDCSFSIEIEVFELPAISIATAETELCEGEMIALSGEGGITYDWLGGVIDGEEFMPELGTSWYWVKGTDANGCSNKDSIDLYVNSSPIVEATVSESEICSGDSIILSGEGADSYAWNIGVEDGETFIPEEGVYYYFVTGTNESGCTGIDSIEVVVNVLPIINILSSGVEMCFGESFIVTGGGAETYNWDMDIEDGVFVTPTSEGTTTYTVVGLDSNGCEGVSSIDITVHGLPEVFATIDSDTICFGSDVTLTGGGASTYSWDVGATDGVAFSPITDGPTLYTVTGTDENGCENFASVNLMINPLPTIIASVDDANICIGESFVFTAVGLVDFSWDMGVVDGEEYTPGGIETTTYTVTGVDENGCGNSASLEATMHLLPVVVATVNQDSICYGESVTFSGVGAATYVWDMDVIDGVPYNSLTTGTTTYSVIGTDIYGCSNSSFVSVNMNEEINIGCIMSDEIGGGDGSMDIVVSGGTPTYTFDWNNDGTGDFDDNEDLFGAIAGEYMVVVRDSRMCEQTHVANIDSQLGLETEENSSLAIYPNPFNDLVTISYNGNFNYAIYSINGDVVENGFGTNQKALDLQSLADGVYFMQLNGGANTITKKIVKR